MASAVMMIGKHVMPRVQIKNKNMRNKKNRNAVRANCSSSSSTVQDPYQILRIHRDASANEVKKAFRQLALKYHPDVCRGNNCQIQFHQINEAYNTVMSHLRGESTANQAFESYSEVSKEPLGGVNDPDWDLWEEWMGWEGAGIRDYSSHINPYI